MFFNSFLLTQLKLILWHLLLPLTSLFLYYSLSSAYLQLINTKKKPCITPIQGFFRWKATALPSLSYIPYIFFFYKSFMLPFLLYIGYNGNLPFYVKNNLILTSVTISLNWGLRFSVNRTLLSRIFLFHLRYSKVLQTLMFTGLSLAPRVGLEPTTPRLTAVCSTIELSRIIMRFAQIYKPFFCILKSKETLTILYSIVSYIASVFSCTFKTAYKKPYSLNLLNLPSSLTYPPLVMPSTD